MNAISLAMLATDDLAATPAATPFGSSPTLWLVYLMADVGFVVIALGIILSMVRLVLGPRLADRAVALDVIAVHLIALVVLFSLQLDSLVLYDGVLVLSLLGFAGTVAVAQFILRPHLRGRRRTWRTVGGAQDRSTEADPT